MISRDRGTFLEILTASVRVAPLARGGITAGGRDGLAGRRGVPTPREVLARVAYITDATEPYSPSYLGEVQAEATLLGVRVFSVEVPVHARWVLPRPRSAAGQARLLWPA